MGGLSRKAYMIEQIKNESNKPVLLLDAGGLLFEQPAMPEPLLESRKIQAAGIIKAMRQMNYAAIGLAAQDLAVGLNFLERQNEAAGLPWLSANLESGSADKKIVQPFIIKHVAEASIAVIGLTDDQINAAALSAEKDFRVLPWRGVLPDILNKVRGKADMVILLSSYPEEVNRQIAGEFNDIHLIIQSGTSAAGKAPRLFGNALITQVGSRGKYIGRMDIDWKPSRRWNQETTTERKQALDRLDRINWRLGRMEKRLKQGERAENSEYMQLLQEKERATEEISRLERQTDTVRDQFSSYTGNFIGLKVSLPEDPAVRAIVLETKEAVNRSHKQKLEEAKRTGKAGTDRLQSIMSGWQACRSCHPEQTRFWQRTKHASAWQTLERANQQFNQDCLICHVTLPTYDMETVIGDNLLAALFPELKGVGCEACHGPGKNHAANPEEYKLSPPGETTCLQCHTPDHDTNFIYEQKVELIRCPAAGH
jgi:2',3'-cyclic-nucleotide 2'-phosphodiesterase (5'-nucleotidase family)